jgi:hypothetical protein
MTSNTKAPTATASNKAVLAYINTHKAGDTIGGGQLYVALGMLTLEAQGHTLAIEGQTAEVFKTGKLVALMGWDARGILNKLVDPAGASMVAPGPNRVERILVWCGTGKVPAKVAPLYLTSKAARQAIAAGKLPAAK